MERCIPGSKSLEQQGSASDMATFTESLAQALLSIIESPYVKKMDFDTPNDLDLGYGDLE